MVRGKKRVTEDLKPKLGREPSVRTFQDAILRFACGTEIRTTKVLLNSDNTPPIYIDDAGASYVYVGAQDGVLVYHKGPTND